MSWLTLTRWEWFKLKGRRVIWALVAVVVGFSALAVFIRFADWQFQKDRDVLDEVIFVPDAPVIEGFEVDVNCTEFLEGGPLPEIPPPYTVGDVDVGATGRECRKEISDINGRLDRLVEQFTLPTAITHATRWTTLLSVPFAAFLTVLVIGSEYGWGTLRTVLMRGVGRTRLLSAKLALVLALLAGVWVAVLVAITFSALVATAAASGVSHGSLGAAALGDALAITGRAFVAGLPYVALAALLSVLFSSWAGGMLAATAASIVYFFVDVFSVVGVILLIEDAAGFGWFATLAEFDLGWNTAAWMFGEGGEPVRGFQLAGAIGKADYPGDLHSLAVLLAFTLVLGGLAFWLMRRQDVAGPSG